MTDNPSSTSPRKAPRLPSVKVSGALAAVLFAVGIVLGAAIGPAPQSSQARAPALPLQTLLSALSPSLAARTATPAPLSATTPAAPATTPAVTSAPAGTSTPAPAATPAAPMTLTPTTSPPATTRTPLAASETTTTPAVSKGTKTPSSKNTPSSTASLPPIAQVWLIVLPGEGFADALTQPATAPYLTGQLVPKGALMSAYSPIAAGALAEDAALLSGQSSPQETQLAAPDCSATSGQPTQPAQSTTTTPTPQTQPSCTPGTAAELASDDAYLRQTLPQIMASAAYKSHGLIVVTFTTSPASATSPASQGSPASAANPASQASTTTTLTTAPPGALLLSPFLRSATRSSTPFHPAAPKQDLERLFQG
jgi:hypothetical protein